ncbi:MAG: alanine racemase [Myxococcota bacterium]|jgi:alanine racemase
MRPTPLAELLPALCPLEPASGNGLICGVTVDSRRCWPGELFFALHGQRTDGHRFVAQALRAGAAAAVVGADYAHDGEERIIRVDDPLAALQRLAAWYRRTRLHEVVAITGSNGKTIVKDALIRLLAGRRCYGSPGSHNSQLGVPLAVLAAPEGVPLAVFEAGASAPGEMALLEKILQPEHGILTNVGLAHLAGFGSRAVTAREKLSLFARSPGWLLLPDEPLLAPHTGPLPGHIRRHSDTDLPRIVEQHDARLSVRFPDGAHHLVQLGTRSAPLVADLMMAAAAAWLLGVPAADIAAAMEGFSPGPTRLEVWRSPEGVTLINDAYSADPLSVQAALRTAAAGGEQGRRIFVFGGMRELGLREAEEHALVGRLAAREGFSRLVLLRQAALAHTAEAFLAARPDGEVTWVDEPAGVRDEIRAVASPGDVVLVKGPRRDGLQDAARALWESMAPKRLIVDLAAIRENIARFRRLLGPGVRVLAMLKAWAYGTELARVACELQAAGVDWIGVAAADEGAMLRRAGVHLPVLVTLLDKGEVDKVVRYRLTPAVYSEDIATALIAAAERADAVIDVHLHVDTGMGRLGVQPEQVGALVALVKGSGRLRATGLMTHFSCADDPDADDYSREQLRRFEEASETVRAAGLTGLIRHAAASAAAVRFPESRLDMIRLGLSLYGVSPSAATAAMLPLQPAVALLGRIAHVAVFQPGQKIGYGGTFTVEGAPLRVGVVGMGYNDGIPWRLSGRGHGLIRGRRAPFLGRVSMDSLVVDLTDHPEAGVGEDVLLFGAHDGELLPVTEVAELAGTIPYEIMVKVDSRRVQRLFVGD